MINYERQSEIFKSLGHPTRLMLAYRLRDKELCVNELNHLIKIDQSILPRHLKTLKDAGVLKIRKDSMQVLYSLRVLYLLNNTLECIENI